MSWRTVHVFVVVTGFVIGAGILGLPIKIGLSGAGFLPGAAMILISAAFQAITALYILEALINMKTPKELTGTAQEVLGRWAGLLVYASLLIYLLGALTAYVTFGGIAVESLTGLPFWAGALAYWLAGSYIVWRGAKSVGTSELVMVFAFLGLLAAVVAVLVASPHFKTENLAWADWGKTFDVYGIAIFAYAAHFAVASAYKEYTGDVRKFAWGAALGFLAPGLAYVAWTAGFMGVIDRHEYYATFIGALSGMERHGLSGLPAPVAVAELGKFGYMWVLGYIFGFLTTFTSYIAGAFTLGRINEELGGWRIGKAANFWILTALPPLALALSRLAAFEEILSTAGDIGASLFSGIIPALMGIAIRQRKGKTIVPGGIPLAVAVLLFYAVGFAYGLGKIF